MGDKPLAMRFIKTKRNHSNTNANNKPGCSFDVKWTPPIAAHGYTELPNIILLNIKELRISAAEFLTLSAILSFKWGEGKPWPSVKSISARTNCEPRTVRKHIASLEAKGILKRVLRSHMSSEYDFSQLRLKLDKLARKDLPSGQDVSLSTVKSDQEAGSNLTAKEDLVEKDTVIRNDSVSNDTAETSKQVRLVYDYFVKQFDSNPASFKLTPKRKSKIKARLKDAGYEMLTKAIENTAANSFYRGENERGWKADLDFITRNYEQVERLSQLGSQDVVYKADW